jgi:hypothetical protein
VVIVGTSGTGSWNEGANVTRYSKSCEESRTEAEKHYAEAARDHFICCGTLRGSGTCTAVNRVQGTRYTPYDSERPVAPSGPKHASITVIRDDVDEDLVQE